MPGEVKNHETTSGAQVRATPELSRVMKVLIADAQYTSELTLGDIRASLLAPHVFWSGEQGELLYAQDQTALVIELDELIERYGAEAPARDFIAHESL